MTHDDEDARFELLSRMATGELDPDGEEARAARAADPELAAEWEHLNSFQQALDHGAAIEREDIASLDGPEDPEDRRRADAVERSVLAELGATASEPRALWARPMTLLAAAAAIVLMVWAFSRPDPSQRIRDDVFLSIGVDAALTPSGPSTAAELQVFEWPALAAPGGPYRIVIERLLTDDARELVHDTGRLDQTVWRPDAGLLAALPSQFIWTVKYRDDEGMDDERSTRVSISK